MARSKDASNETPTGTTQSNDETAAAISRYKRCKSHRPAARRRLVAQLRREGYDVREIVDKLASTSAAIQRDVTLLRKEAAGHQLAAAPERCAPLFLEEAEDVVQKVRKAQHELGEKEGTFFLNLLKLEWTMLVKLAEITRSQPRKQGDDIGDGFGGLSKCSNEELLEQARELGIDVTGFERALRLMPNEAA